MLHHYEVKAQILRSAIYKIFAEKGLTKVFFNDLKINSNSTTKTFAKEVPNINIFKNNNYVCNYTANYNY